MTLEVETQTPSVLEDEVPPSEKQHKPKKHKKVRKLHSIGTKENMSPTLTEAQAPEK